MVGNLAYSKNHKTDHNTRVYFNKIFCFIKKKIIILVLFENSGGQFIHCLCYDTYFKSRPVNIKTRMNRDVDFTSKGFSVNLSLNFHDFIKISF